MLTTAWLVMANYTAAVRIKAEYNQLYGGSSQVLLCPQQERRFAKET
jgi:hypothetical protein